MERHSKQSFIGKNTKGEEIIISNYHSERKWKDCEDKGIYMYWNGPSRKRSRLVRIISKIWGDKVSSLNSFAEIIWFILCQNAQDKEEIMQSDYVFYKGHHIKFLAWQPNLNKNHIKNTETIKWMESIEIRSELMEETTIKNIGNSLGTVIGFEDNFSRTNKIRVLVETNQNHPVNKKIITNKSIYNLTFKEYVGDINKIIDPNLSKSHIKNNIKDHIILKKRTGKKLVRKRQS